MNTKSALLLLHHRSNPGGGSMDIRTWNAPGTVPVPTHLVSFQGRLRVPPFIIFLRLKSPWFANLPVSPFPFTRQHQWVDRSRTPKLHFAKFHFVPPSAHRARSPGTGPCTDPCWTADRTPGTALQQVQGPTKVHSFPVPPPSFLPLKSKIRGFVGTRSTGP